MSFRVGRGTSAPVEGAWPYTPVVEALADVCRRHPTLLDGLADHHREEIDRALAGTEMPWTGGSSHQRLFVAVGELVRLASATHGLLLTIDDMHDADDASLRLLHYVARSTASERVCIVLGHRTSPVTDTFAETRHSLIDGHGATALELGPLREEGVAAMVARHVETASSEQTARIAVLSRGIPFAVNELARRAAAEPQWVQALDASMVSGIEPATTKCCNAVAVIGATFDTDEFVALSGVSEDLAFDHLDRARPRWWSNPRAPATGSDMRWCAMRCSTTCHLTVAAASTEMPPSALIELDASAARHRAPPPRGWRGERGRPLPAPHRPRPMPPSARTATALALRRAVVLTPRAKLDSTPFAAGQTCSTSLGDPMAPRLLPGGARRRRRRCRSGLCDHVRTR